MLVDTIIFYAAALIAVFGALMMITVRNPVGAVLYLILSLVAQAVLYVQLAALFVGALLIIVYAGAILVLFLFVIMLLNLKGEHFDGPRPKLSLFSKYGLSFLFFIEVVIIIREVSFGQGLSEPLKAVSDSFGGVAPVAELLFTKYLYPFELTSILLLVAVVGAVLMAKKDKEDEKGDI